MPCEDPAGQTAPISVDQVCGGRRAKERERESVCVCVSLILRRSWILAMGKGSNKAWDVCPSDSDD